MNNYDLIEGGLVPIKAWTRGVQLDDSAMVQLRNTAGLPIIHSHLAVMPDVHWGLGATIGSVIPTVGAIVPAAVGVDLGCGMCAVRTSLVASDLPDSLRGMRKMIEQAVPHGRTGGNRRKDRGSWGELPKRVSNLWTAHLDAGFRALCARYPVFEKTNNIHHLGTLGTGNHFIEVCLDEQDRVWFMLHSGSRGVGNRIASIFIEKAKQDMQAHLGNLPDRDLAYLSEGSPTFEDYIEGVGWAQDFARLNRQVMMELVIEAVRKVRGLPRFQADLMAVNCHHNYVEREHHFGADCWVTRKGALRAGAGELGIIPGSMGAKSFIVRGKGNADSFHSCSHGAGRAMSRTEAKRRYSIDDHIQATEGVECRKDAAVIDETPMAYKDIDKVMQAQADLVDVVHTLKQVVCVKG
ncbi:MAG: RtcB family protein [Planctomycetota bacterium]|nr:RtcB family protein [Planctomycetota bacterium]